MIVTNNFSVPQPLYDDVVSRIREPWPSDRKISVTELCDSPRIRMLRRRHWAEITSDVTEMLPSWRGQVLHERLAKATSGDAEVEERVEIERQGWVLTGQYDYAAESVVFDGDVLRDYKNCSMAATYNGCKPQWQQQINLYNHLRRLVKSKEAKRLEVWPLYIDWKKSQSEWAKARGDDYPDPAECFVVPIWTPEECESFIATRLRLHEEALTSLPECTDEEVWRRPDVWAVKKKGNKRAIRGGLHESLADAYAQSTSLGSQYEVEHRPGNALRCSMYCSLKPFCEQGQRLSKEERE